MSQFILCRQLVTGVVERMSLACPGSRAVWLEDHRTDPPTIIYLWLPSGQSQQEKS